MEWWFPVLVVFLSLIGIFGIFKIIVNLTNSFHQFIEENPDLFKTHY
mgnify:CR=1 FL=1